MYFRFKSLLVVINFDFVAWTMKPYSLISEIEALLTEHVVVVKCVVSDFKTQTVVTVVESLYSLFEVELHVTYCCWHV